MSENKSLAELLEAYEIPFVDAHYEGALGDGGVNTVEFLNADRKAANFFEAPADEDQVASAVTAFVNKHLPEGWELMDGAWGTCKIDAAAGKAKFDHNINTSYNDPFEIDLTND